MHRPQGYDQDEEHAAGMSWDVLALKRSEIFIQLLSSFFLTAEN